MLINSTLLTAAICYVNAYISCKITLRVLKTIFKPFPVVELICIWALYWNWHSSDSTTLVFRDPKVKLSELSDPHIGRHKVVPSYLIPKLYANS